MSELHRTKRCSRCKRTLPGEAFASNRSVPGGLQAYCRACSADHYRQRREALRPRRAEINRDAYFRRKYGISAEQLAQMIEEQVGICPICLSARARHVDHDHETGKVRGVLCSNCNSALGHIRDDPDVMRRAMAYVEGNVWKPTLVAPGVYQLPS